MNNKITEYVKDFYEWPRRWMGMKCDGHVGEEINKAFEPFILYLIDQDLAMKTVQKHADNLWLLGGEIVRDVSTFDEYGEDIIRKTEESVDDEGGPLCRHLHTENDLRSYAGTCRKFHRYLKSREARTSRWR